MTRIRHRAVAVATTFVVAWTALWPVVASAKALFAHEEVMLCHQAGTMVAPGEAPMPMRSPGQDPLPGKPGGTHCPLCIMAFYGSQSTPVAIPPFEFSTLSVSLETYSAPLPAGLEVPLPPSRAPPAPAGA